MLSYVCYVVVAVVDDIHVLLELIDDILYYFCVLVIENDEGRRIVVS